MGGGLVALQFFGHSKRTLELLISVRNDILGHWADTIIPGKKRKKINAHP